MSLESRLHNIRQTIPLAMLLDQDRVSKRLRDIKKTIGRGKKSGERIEKEAASLERRLERSVLERETRLAQRPPITYPEDLPITTRKDDILRVVQQNQVVIISGDTGSGKSTQIPKMCLEAGRGIAGKIGCTQPRRIAAGTIARRIAEEMGEELGKSVGYRIRFRDRTPPTAYIKILTDGMLLAETQGDPGLYQYDTLIIDEAHERTLNIDFLLGILKMLLRRRPELKLIISSATLDTEKFSKFFDQAPVIQVSGRTYPVEVEYLPVDGTAGKDDDPDYVDRAVQALERIMGRRDSGDVLVFMPTEQDILETCERLEGRGYPNTAVLPLFGRLPWSRQQRVFSVHGRKIVVATNVAETSLTIPGIKYVADAGLARISRYMPGTRTTALPISNISRASADQRKGRCGRVRNGVCIRLYSEDDYNARPEFTPPEILRSNLAEVILRMISLKLGDIATFPFLDRPNQRSINDGFSLLMELGAISGKGREVSLTEKGRLMARMPLDPRISRMMIEAEKEGCVEEAAVMAAALSIQDPRERPMDRAAQADQAHAPFRDKASDFITLLNIWTQYHRQWEALKTQNKMRKFCTAYFLSFPRMREWIQIHEQICSIMEEHGRKGKKAQGEQTKEPMYARIHRAILGGFLSNIAQKKEKNIYQAARGREVMVFPGSTLFNKGPQWIVAAEMVKTSRLFARTVAKIESDWLESLGGDLCRSTYSSPHWEKNRGEVRAVEQVTLFGLTIVSGRSISYGSIDPEESHRLFVQSALVEGEIRGELPFLKYNRELIQGVQDLEEKVRRRGILVDDQVMADFYSRRLKGICDIRTLKKMIKEQGGDGCLRMREDDLLMDTPDEEKIALFPDQVGFGNRLFDCSYRFAPGEREDGVTVSVPSGLLSLLSPEQLERGVPGLLREKITALVKGLPKRYRKLLVPVSQTVDVIIREMEQGDRPLLSGLSAFVFDRFQVDIPASVWASVEIPDHLKMRVSVTDQEGREIESGRDIGLLGQKATDLPPGEETAAWKKARMQWEKEGLTQWAFDSLPLQITVADSIEAYPGLEAEGTHVNIRLFRTPDEARRSHLEGVRKLFTLQFSKDFRFVKHDLALPEKGTRGVAYFGGARVVAKALYGCLLKLLFQKDIRTREAFMAEAEAMRSSLFSRTRELRDQVLKVLDGYEQTRSTLHRIEGANGSNTAVLKMCARIREDLERLVPVNFLEIHSPERLGQLLRYLRALEIRAERGAYDPSKESQKMDRAAAFIEGLNGLTQDDPIRTSSQEKKAALEEFRWMIEEFKVSLFAQELKTLFPVSEKRLEKKLKEIERMV
jgi:ATP-dependent helicase HrpA